jgi:putative transposase
LRRVLLPGTPRRISQRLAGGGEETVSAGLEAVHPRFLEQIGSLNITTQETARESNPIATALNSLFRAYRQALRKYGDSNPILDTSATPRYLWGMPRSARLVIPGLPYHITQRGNNRTGIFLQDEDRRAYIKFLLEYSQANALSLLGYCLMDNHVHLIGIPGSADALSRGVGRAHLRYAQLFNWQHNRCGHLWQGRFYSCALDEAHLVAAMCYVERNPVRAGLVSCAEDYPWSSAAAHLGQPERSGLLSPELWQKHWPATVWKEMLSQPEDEAQLHALRLQTRTGRPLGDAAFIEKLELMLGKILRPRKAGRHKKPRKECRK